jgi:hypothetical protein
MNKRKLLLSAILWSFLLKVAAQAPPPACGFSPVDPSPNCGSVCTSCDFTYALDSNNGGSSGDYLDCGNGIGIDLQNAVFYAFVAGSNSIGIQIETFNCVTGLGLQAAIMGECLSDVLVCHVDPIEPSAPFDPPITLSSDEFVPGRTYYLMLDGFDGAVCDYEIQLLFGSTIAPPIGAAGPIEGSSSICPFGSLVFKVPPIPGAGRYHWTAPPGARINGRSNSEYLNTPEVVVQFGQMGGQVCVKGVGSCAQEGAQSCKVVNVTPIPPTILPPIIITVDDLPYYWEAGGTGIIEPPGIHQLSALFVSWQGCDSMVRQLLTISELAPGQIKGTVFWDNNNNGVRDPNEQPYSNSLMLTSSAGNVVNSAMDGNYIFPGQTPGDSIRAVPPLPGLNVSPAFRLVQNGVQLGYDFGLFPVPNVYDLNVVMNHDNLRPGFNSNLTIVCRNSGLVSISGVEVSVTLPTGLQNIAPVPMATSIIGNRYIWDLGELLPGETVYLNIPFYVPVSTPLGTIKTFNALIEPIADDLNPNNNEYTIIATVVGSYDPNDKQVVPSHVTPAMLANNAPFEYAIRFQNTGTFPAEFVRIVDTLGEMVDPASFKFLAASHPCTWKISGSGVVEFYFDNIYLPDSTSNEPGSHGFVKFTVKPKKDLPVGSVVENFCDIYFDYNSPVRTNTAGTQVVYFLPGEGLAVQDALKIRPNPAALIAVCSWKTPAPADGRLRIFDISGLPKMVIAVAKDQLDTPIEVQSLSPGLYFVLLEAGDLILTNKLVVVPLAQLRSE